MAWAAGTRVGDYEIVGTLGYGGMGEVYRVRHTISDRIEAMKLLRGGQAGPQSKEMLDRFTREIRVLATLQHPNIATLHTAFRHGEELVMVMECVEGEDLGRRLPAGFTLEESLRYTRQVLEALHYAHIRGIIHRDIKPSNVMITPEGVVKLLDFGLALGVLSINGPDQRLTTTGALIGSLHYIAPEQISGEPHDARSDIYAVGVTLYEMITGRLPIEGTTHLQVIAGHLQSAPVPPSERNPKIPAGLSATVMRALAKNPKDRWPTADAFLKALENAPLSTAAEDVSQLRITQLPAANTRPVGTPRPSSSHRPESLSEITRQLAVHVGPIASVLVRRASSSTTNLREMCDALAAEIASPAARQKFLSAVHSHLRGSGAY
jgi:eukaryotic-like serine/threonine-protein kinase